MIRTGVVRNAVLIGVELISPFMDWDNRNVAVLFGDGCAAVVVQASEREGRCWANNWAAANVRHVARRARHGLRLRNRDVACGDTSWDFDGQEIFRHATCRGMSKTSAG